MPERDAAIAAFLAATPWAGAARRPLAGDASNRRYERLDHPAHGKAVLMDAPPERGEDVRPFVSVARHLRGVGLSAPEVLAEDAEAGLLLLEDLGDALYARVVEDAPGSEAACYAAAVDVLAELHRHPAPAGLPAYGPESQADAAMLAWEWYRGALGAEGTGAPPRDALAAALHRHAPDEGVMVLRDYHALNLLWLPERAGLARVGLLDFQDAATGHAAYDLVSLLGDARRDVPGEVRAAAMRRYLDATGRDEAAFRAAAAVLGAQRNLRILGTFARLWLRDGKAGYLPLLPRVWRTLTEDLRHPALAALAQRVASDLPAPTPERLSRLAAA